ncbi:uncharacterized protein A1O5_09468 [Cladophialophora psammophila CBS 110553]|uniref:Uncharacterized protein n=1 Tax=Cladophialophora psammophila CBS 110553 TaxID=1182543 RepID=W9WR47_9EURO|nr:uncharacterized protein A1O5_09468 [Cladophialophora psammophila CBS 110553]EXJ67455.1 hypothetical protein A1O5_09468 [Cladophialophora psammophila CBS 110553]
MDHLFDDEDLQATGLKLPTTAWLGFDHDTTQSYGVVDFETYPLLRGWTQAELLDLTFGRLSRSVSYTLSMLQSWFTLGFLEATFRQRFRTRDFVSGDQVFRTRFLRQFTKEKIGEVYDMPDAEVVQFLEALDEAQKMVYQWTVKLELQGNKTSKDLKEERIAPTMRLCTLIGEAIRHFQDVSSMICLSWLKREGPSWRYSDLNRNLLIQQLVKKGWCPSTFELLFKTSHSTIELAALLEAKDLKSGRHQGCTKNSCIAYQLLEETYQTSHVDSSCACSFIAAPPHRLATILRQGEVPVLNLDALLDDSNEETVTSLKGKANVIAFSHVWSDGPRQPC